MCSTDLLGQVREMIARQWDLSIDRGVPLSGGEESDCFRCGEFVIRISPTWRTDAELEWAYRVAAGTAAAVPEAASPLPTTEGRLILRHDDRPISIWPLLPGKAATPSNMTHRAEAATLLARLHRALAKVPIDTERPSLSEPGEIPDPVLVDDELDRWMQRFHDLHRRRQPLHGDFYASNVLTDGDRLTGVIDWDDALVGPPEQELAWAAWEWTDGRTTLDIDAGLAFAQRYAAAGGTAAPLTREEYVQLTRDRIRRDVSYSQASGSWGTSTDPEDIAYEATQMRAFATLESMV